MGLTLSEARKLLGKSSEKYSDTQLLEMVNVVDLLCDLAIDTYLYKYHAGREVKIGGEGVRRVSEEPNGDARETHDKSKNKEGT